MCPACGKLVGVRDDKCWSCGRRSPGMWGFASVLRRIGSDLGFAKLVIFTCGALYVLMLVTDPGGIRGGGLLSFFAPSNRSIL